MLEKLYNDKARGIRFAGDVNRNYFILIAVVHLGIGIIKEKLTENCAILSDGAGHV